jgi:hypothetical protein
MRFALLPLQAIALPKAIHPPLQLALLFARELGESPRPAFLQTPPFKMFWVYLLSVALIGLTACRSTPVDSPRPTSPITQLSPSTQPSPSTKPKVQDKPKVQEARKAPEKPTSPDKTTIPLTIYKLDNQCNKFVSEKVRVSKTKTLEKTVGQVLETIDNADFSLAGYRVSVAKGIATIDLRTAPGAKRQLKSLSNCEQLALYGGLRKTLTGNKAFKIKSVRFTDRGQIIKP